MFHVPDVFEDGLIAINQPCPIATDVTVTGVTVTGATVTEAVNTPFDVTVQGSVHNNGLFNPVNVDLTVQLDMPPGCSTTGNPSLVSDLLFPISAAPWRPRSSSR